MIQFYLKLDSKEIEINIVNGIDFFKKSVIKNLFDQNKKYFLYCQFSLGFIDLLKYHLREKQISFRPTSVLEFIATYIDQRFKRRMKTAEQKNSGTNSS